MDSSILVGAFASLGGGVMGAAMSSALTSRRATRDRRALEAAELRNLMNALERRLSVLETQVHDERNPR